MTRLALLALLAAPCASDRAGVRCVEVGPFECIPSREQAEPPVATDAGVTEVSP